MKKKFKKKILNGEVINSWLWIKFSPIRRAHEGSMKVVSKLIGRRLPTSRVLRIVAEEKLHFELLKFPNFSLLITFPGMADTRFGRESFSPFFRKTRLANQTGESFSRHLRGDSFRLKSAAPRRSKALHALIVLRTLSNSSGALKDRAKAGSQKNQYQRIRFGNRNCDVAF